MNGDLVSTGAALTISKAEIRATCLNLGPVKVYPDGRIERTEQFTTEEDAALKFWAAVNLYMPLRRE